MQNHVLKEIAAKRRISKGEVIRFKFSCMPKIVFANLVRKDFSIFINLEESRFAKRSLLKIRIPRTQTVARPITRYMPCDMRGGNSRLGKKMKVSIRRP